jgi:hypothetical protein
MVIIGFTSCSKSLVLSSSSRATGWNVGSKKLLKKQEAGRVLYLLRVVPWVKVQDDVMHDWNNTPTQQHVQSFYMDETEVTNLMYLST